MDTQPGGGTVLIVDDQLVNLKVAVAALQHHGLRILTARDGEAALARAQLAQPDLLLLDVKLPGIDGIETCRRLKADPRTASIPVILLTALLDSATLERGLAAGAADYMTRPVEIAILLARTQTHLRLRKLQRERALLALRPDLCPLCPLCNAG
jgi:CheY-like chemotaxis protein